MISYLREAAQLARKASTVTTDRRVVEVVLTELGLIVRGTFSDGPTRQTVRASFEVSWPDLDVTPHLAPNAVRMVTRALEESGEDQRFAPVRAGE